jgi:hypothetical protein
LILLFPDYYEFYDSEREELDEKDIDEDDECEDYIAFFFLSSLGF